MQIATHLVSFNNNRQQTVVVKGLVYTSGTQSLETLCARLIGFLIIGRKFNIFDGSKIDTVLLNQN